MNLFFLNCENYNLKVKQVDTKTDTDKAVKYNLTVRHLLMQERTGHKKMKKERKWW